MNRGKFFSLDLGASCLHEGISVFNYTDIFDADVIERKGQTTPRYPIFVSITPTSVKFILQYCVYLQNGNFVSFLDSIDGEINYQIRHMEEVLIELPLITTQGFSLASTLKRLYDTPFPIDLKEEKNYIKELIQRRYDEGIGQYASMRNRDENRENIHYSRLFVWDLYSEKEKKYKLCGEPGKYNKVLRKLVLDFFFDMMHSDVFKNSMYFDAMYSRFMSDYFCSAILHKSEFYYQRALVCDLLENNNLLISESLMIYADNFDKAEAKWVKCILAPESDSYFEFEPKWFEPNKSEKKDNYFSKLYNWFVGNYKFQIYNSWFISAEEELQRIYYNEKNSIVSSSEDLCRIAQYSKNIEVKNISFDTNLIQQRRIDSSKWFIRRYNFDNAYTSQSKFRPTILEEFMSILFTDMVCGIKERISRNAETVNYGSVRAYTNLFFSGAHFQDFISNPSVGVNEKNQDFAIFRRTKLNIDGASPIDISLPVVAIENKTYLDKTMLEGSIATAEKIKSGNPYCLFCIVSECYDVSLSVDPAYSRIDQIFVLRKNTPRDERQQIFDDVVCKLVDLVDKHLHRPWSDIQNKMQSDGILI